MSDQRAGVMRTKALLVAALITCGAVSLAACGASTDKTAVPPTSTGAASGQPRAAESPSTETETETPAEDDEAPTDLPLGETMTVTGTDDNGKPFTQTVTVSTMKVQHGAPSEYDSPPVNKYVSFLVTFVGLTGTSSYNPYSFTLRAADGTEYDQAMATFEPALQSGTLRHGKRAKGWIGYDIPSGTYSLEFTSNIADGNPGSWKVNVK